MSTHSTGQPTNASGVSVDAVVAELRALRDDVRRAVGEDAPGRGSTSVDNMRAYLALRRHDNRELQAALARLGLSSLGRSEGHVLATLEQVLAIVELLAGDAPTAADSFDESNALLDRRVAALFGDGQANPRTRIMVTLPSEAASDCDLIASLVTAGMDCARINSAHDDVAAWTAMASRVRTASETAGRRVPILVDLPGPKLRTGPIEPGPEVVRLRPRRDELGAIIAPARAWLTARGSGGAVPAGAGVVLPVAPEWLEALSPGDHVHFSDARGRHRELEVGAGSAHGRWAEAHQGAYLVSGTALTAKSAGATRVGPLPARGSFIPLAIGDTLLLTRDPKPGRCATAASPARISCTLPEAFDAASVGDSVWLDDGKFGGIARRVTPSAIEVEITHAPPSGGRLRAEKGINLPDISLSVRPSHDEDERIAFAVANADMLGLSFVSTRDDVRAIADALARSGGDHLGLILKIETRAGFDALPELLSEALARAAPCGVMIARGDLAIEVGWERMAEVQEEILWLCEAAHVPVIWATQVLDTLARTGLASRAEITDAASGARADCVMLNKGPMIVAAIAMLDDILTRMATHRQKNTSLLRRLRAWS
jgi:pyruvate kinase